MAFIPFWNRYPYTDFHELNLDWVISELKRIEESLVDMKEEIEADTIAAAEAYVDGKLGGFLAEFNELKREFRLLQDNFDSLDADFVTLSNRVESLFTQLDNKIDASVVAVNQRTDLRLQDMYNQIFEDLTASLAQIKVINYFTGEQVSVQDMFNYLAKLHLNDSLDYDTMALRAKTYTQFANMNMTFENLVAHGNTLYI